MLSSLSHTRIIHCESYRLELVPSYSVSFEAVRDTSRVLQFNSRLTGSTGVACRPGGLNWSRQANVPQECVGQRLSSTQADVFKCRQ